MKGARDYVDQQLAIMAEYGDAASLSPEQYEALVLRIHRIAERVRKVLLIPLHQRT
jgi:hypothetical protein